MTQQHGGIALSTETSRILSLPVVFTPEAWQQAVHLDGAEPDDITDRLSNTLQAAYQAALSEPATNLVPFGLHRLPPDGNPSSPLWLDLQVSHDDDPQLSQLLISLKQPTQPLAA